MAASQCILLSNFVYYHTYLRCCFYIFEHNMDMSVDKMNYVISLKDEDVVMINGFIFELNVILNVMLLHYRHITARSEVHSYQSEQTNYAFSPRPSKKRDLSRTSKITSAGAAAGSSKVAPISKKKNTVVSKDMDMDKDEEFEPLKPTKSFDARYLASAWNERHASPSRKPRSQVSASSRRGLFQDSSDNLDFQANAFGMFYVMLRCVMLFMFCLFFFCF